MLMMEVCTVKEMLTFSKNRTIEKVDIIKEMEVVVFTDGTAVTIKVDTLCGVKTWAQAYILRAYKEDVKRMAEKQEQLRRIEALTGEKNVSG